MMRSLFSGVSGLKTHQTKMDVIGNNIANVNTTAYKTMQINFADLMYQTTQSATGPNANTGAAGTNPKQIGLGVQTAAITTKITEQGATQSTGNPFDLKITGDEFFVVSDGSNTYFTRDGSFYVDAAGNLAMSSTGYNVMGWQVDEETGNIKQDTVSKLVVLGKDTQTYPGAYTTSAIGAGVIDWNNDEQGENAGKTLNLQIYDNVGYSYTAKFTLHNANHPTGGDYEYYMELEDILDSNGDSILTDTLKDKITFGEKNRTVNVNETYSRNVGTYTAGAYSFTYTDGNGVTASYTVNATDLFDYAAGTTGSITALKTGNVTPNNAAGGGATLTTAEAFGIIFGTSLDPADIKSAKLDDSGSLILGQKQVDGAIIHYNGLDGTYDANNSTGGTNGINLDLSALGEAFTTISVDLSKTVVADNKGTTTLKISKGDEDNKGTGRAFGVLSGVSIQTNGMIYASYSNGQQRLLGQIAVAEFANASGLQKEGDNLYSATQNSGDFDGIGVDISANGDRMNTGQLEMSNVDLSSEFTDMITTQRGFQANSRIITVSDTLLEELVNLKR